MPGMNSPEGAVHWQQHEDVQAYIRTTGATVAGRSGFSVAFVSDSVAPDVG